MKVLLVDDHPLFRQGLKFILDDLHSELEFFEAGDFTEVESYRESEAFDLILLDYHLAGEVSDRASLLAVREAYPAATIVVLSSEDNPEIILSAVDNGAAGFIPKSSTPEILMAALKLVLAGGVYLPPEAHHFSPKTAAASPDASPSQNSNSVLSILSERQAETLMAAIRGKPNKIIARELGIAEGTVKAHLSAAFRLLDVRNRTEAVYKAAEIGLRI